MKKVLTILVMSMFFLGLVPAQEIATEEDIELAGVTPDQPFLYGLEIAFEKLTELFIKNAKIEHAKERLAEVKVMIAENKLEASERARKEFDKVYLSLENSSQLEGHKLLSDSLGKKIAKISSVRMNLTQIDIFEIKNLISNHKERILKEVEEIKKSRPNYVASQGV